MEKSGFREHVSEICGAYWNCNPEFYRAALARAALELTGEPDCVPGASYEAVYRMAYEIVRRAA